MNLRFFNSRANALGRHANPQSVSANNQQKGRPIASVVNQSDLRSVFATLAIRTTSSPMVFGTRGALSRAIARNASTCLAITREGHGGLDFAVPEAAAPRSDTLRSNGGRTERLRLHPRNFTIPRQKPSRLIRCLGRRILHAPSCFSSNGVRHVSVKDRTA
jgi:hypothetical protein